MADEYQRAAMTAERGRQASQIKDSSERKKYISESSLVDTNPAKAAESTSAKGNELQRGKVMGSMKKGGRVKRTGTYKLHKGEKVTSAKKSRKRGR